MLNTYHLDELLQKINEEKDNISILIEKKKAKTAKKLEAIELYMQNVIDKLRQFTPSLKQYIEKLNTT